MEKLAITNNKKIYNYRDYLSFLKEEKIEIINGEIYYMTPAPSRMHQKISMELSRQISNYLLDKNCEVYAAPFDVRFYDESDKDEDINTIVQPDITIICDKNKLDERGCKGSPDFIIEIMSPSSVGIDSIKKFTLYEKYKVKEYWTIHPIDGIARTYYLNNENKYIQDQICLIDENKIHSKLFDGLEIDLSNI